MEIKITTRQILKILYVISWVIFIGVSIEAGSFSSMQFFLWGSIRGLPTTFICHLSFNTTAGISLYSFYSWGYQE